MKIYTYRTIIEPDEKGFHGFVPLLRGLHTVGKTIEETQKNLREAIRCHLEGLLKDKITPPKEQDTIETIQTFTFNA
ncbi:MAG: type II toxin-antitoxin system HicB family antitoxin [Candidatus Levybacteria bacterium]|nr:type II toxin-antitoxin system HicB family antitoxin [Candidatus Levybacteria bacterium]